MLGLPPRNSLPPFPGMSWTCQGQSGKEDQCRGGESKTICVLIEVLVQGVSYPAQCGCQDPNIVARPCLLAAGYIGVEALPGLSEEW